MGKDHPGGYLAIKNWTQYQHFRKKRPPWIKLYTDQNRDRKVASLHPIARDLFRWIWIETAMEGEWLPNDVARIRAEYVASLKRGTREAVARHIARHLDTLISQRFLTVSTSPTISSEREVEREIEKETPIVPLQGTGVLDLVPEPAKPKKQRPASPYTAEFLAFWQAYPRKVGKGAAWKAWKARKDRPSNGAMLESLDLHKRSDQWQRDGGQFIPHPATWLNQARWEDEPDAADKEVWI